MPITGRRETLDGVCPDSQTMLSPKKQGDPETRNNVDHAEPSEPDTKAQILHDVPYLRQEEAASGVGKLLVFKGDRVSVWKDGTINSVTYILPQ